MRGSARCPRCHYRMKVCQGKDGPYWGCLNFPRCLGRSTLAEGEATRKKDKPRRETQPVTLKPGEAQELCGADIAVARHLASEPRPFVVTEAWIREYSTTGQFGWTVIQVRALGLKWPLKKGWIGVVVGKHLSLSAKAAFEAGRGKCSARTVEIKKNREAKKKVLRYEHGVPIFAPDPAAPPHSVFSSEQRTVELTKCWCCGETAEETEQIEGEAFCVGCAKTYRARPR